MPLDDENATSGGPRIGGGTLIEKGDLKQSDSPPLNILMVSGTYRPRIDGSAIAVENLIRCLKSRGHNVDLLTRKFPGANRTETSASLRIFRVGPSGTTFPHRFLLSANFILAGVRILHDKDYHLIHCHGFAALFAGAFLGGVFHRPIIATFHGFTSQTGESSRRKRAPDLIWAMFRPVEGLLTRRAKIIVAQSVSFKKLVQKLYRVPSERIQTIPHVVDTGFFHFEHRKSKDPTILFVGGLTTVHGPMLLIKSVALLRNQIPQIRLILVGGGPLRLDCEKLIASLGVGNITQLTGKITDRQLLRKAYASSWVLAIPQDYAGYFLSLAALEAMSTGRPVVATQSLDPKLAEYGVYAVTRNELSLSQMLAKVLKMSDTEYRQLSLSARTYVEENCSYPAVAKKLEDLYLHAMEHLKTS